MNEMNEINIAYESGINWTWYLAYTVQGSHIIIHRNYRLHKFDCKEHPTTTTRFRLIENNPTDRIVVAVSLDSVRYNMRDPIDVWSLPE